MVCGASSGVRQEEERICDLLAILDHHRVSPHKDSMKGQDPSYGPLFFIEVCERPV
jgi:hypothetical protein